MILELADGQSATLRDRLTYAQARPVRAAFLAARDDPQAMADLPLTLMVAYVSSWHVMDFDGKAVDLNTPELAPDDLIIEIATAATELWKGAAAGPKAGSASSPSMPPEPLSAAMTP